MTRPYPPTAAVLAAREALSRNSAPAAPSAPVRPVQPASLSAMLAPSGGQSDPVAELRVARSVYFGGGAGARGGLQGIAVACLDPPSAAHEATIGSTVRRADRSGLEWLQRRGVIDAVCAAAGREYAAQVIRWRSGIGAPGLAELDFDKRRGGRRYDHGDRWAELVRDLEGKRQMLKAMGSLAVVDRVAVEEETLAGIGEAIVAAARRGGAFGVEGLSPEEAGLAELGEKALRACLKARLVRGLRALARW